MLDYYLKLINSYNLWLFCKNKLIYCRFVYYYPRIRTNRQYRLQAVRPSGEMRLYRSPVACPAKTRLKATFL